MTTFLMWTLALIAVVSILWIAMVAAVAFAARGRGEMADAPALGAGGRKPVGVRVPPPA